MSDDDESLRERIERVLVMAEWLLAERVAPAPEQEDFDRHLAFRWDAVGGERGRLRVVSDPAHFELEDLVGVDRALARLVDNIEQFLGGLPYNHVLLYGERGTGKSSAVKGLLQRYAGRGLRLIEIQKADLVQLPRVLEAIRADAGRHHFLIFCDDLSFGEGEGGYRELKAALEGSIEAPPANVCIVATSNRRHLMPESMADNRAARLDEHGELHLGEALEERLALSDRFGLVIGFYAPDQATYLAIVEHYLKKEGFDLSDPAAREEALRFVRVRANRSGRAARQFVDDFVGRARLRGG